MFGSLCTRTLQDPPFVFKNESAHCHGNACFYGYAVDLLARLAGELGFTYTLYEVPDGKYGALNEYTREWNGMVRELIPDKTGLTVRGVRGRGRRRGGGSQGILTLPQGSGDGRHAAGGGVRGWDTKSRKTTHKQTNTHTHKHTHAHKGPAP